KPDEIGLRINVIDFYTRAKEIQKANEHLDRILASKSDVSETVRAWANRRRSLITAAGGTYSDTVDALKLLSFKGKKKNEVATSDLRTKAAILSKRPFKQDRLELVRVLEEIATRQKLTSADQLQLAQLYESTGDWTKSRETMRSLLNDEPSNPVLLALYVRALLRHQDAGESALSEAESLVDRLETIETDTFRTKTTQARLLAAQNRGSEAAKLLKDFVEGRLVAPVEQTLRDLLESEKAEESLAAIEKLFEDTEDQGISDVLTQVRELLQQNKRKEAIDILKKIVQAQDGFAELQIESMRSAAALLEKLGEIKTAEEMYREYVSRSRRPETVVSLITFLGRQKRYQQAIDLCEKSWDKVSTEVLASVTMATIREGKLPNRNVQRLEQQLETALKKDPNSASVLLVLAELRAGFLSGSRSQENEATLTRFLNSPRVETLCPDEQTTHHYARLFYQLRKQGTPIPTNDLWIASLVVQHDLVLCAQDQHFDQLPQLPRHP
ncbi:MAG: hypothetical protein IIB03_02275, partial [Acidobacteria bacterium]|nr:hypothetical protein [Acidobacteriota bacterium]